MSRRAAIYYTFALKGQKGGLMADKAAQRSLKLALQEIINDARELQGVHRPDLAREIEQLALQVNGALALPDWPALQEDKPMADDQGKDVAAGAADDPDTGTGQQLKDYLPYWDKPDEELEKDGHSLIAIHAVKAGLASKGFQLKHPAPEAQAPGFHDLGEGGVPPNWEELIKQGKLG